MAIPDFQSLMLPLLRLCADGGEHARRDLTDTLAEECSLTADERRQLISSGRQPRFNNRVHWAISHLKMAGLLESTRRGVYRITDRGKSVIAQKPAQVNIALLRQFPEYDKMVRGWRERARRPRPPRVHAPGPDSAKTPAEQLEEAYQTLRANLARELLDQLQSATPGFFEKVVIEVLVKMGYGGSREDAGQAIGGSGDEGIDGIIKEDRLGLDVIYVQAKKWDSSVSRPEIQKFAGALQGRRARKGIFITTSDFSQQAREYAASIDSKIVLIDGRQLAEYMIDFGVGVATEAIYEVKRLDSDYFTEP